MPEQEITPLYFAESVTVLADLRQEIDVLSLDLQFLRAKLESSQPELMAKIDKAKLDLTTRQVAEKALAGTIRENAILYPGYASQHAALKRRMVTTVDYVLQHGIRLAMVFCPELVKLDHAGFQRWVLAHQKEPTLTTGMVVSKQETYTIASDLTPWLSKETESPSAPNPDISSYAEEPDR